MPIVTFTAPDGSVEKRDGAVGDSVMQTAVRNGVPGIVGECGGTLSCATCHVFVDPGFLDRLPEMDELEDEMLDGTVVDREPNSRLSCQIKLTDELDGLLVTTPESQV